MRIMRWRKICRNVLQTVKTRQPSRRLCISTVEVAKIKASRSYEISALLSIVASCSVIYCFSGAITSCNSTDQIGFPETPAFHSGNLKVSDIHTISYSEYGNPHGKPILFIHGGPGGYTSSKQAQYFDPSVYRVILVDQRGCGKSTPFAEIKENTTFDLVEDFEKLRKVLGIKKWQLFGGSWGSTLALTYATEHPEIISELILRGIFLATKDELAWVNQGPGSNHIFPEDWEPYEQLIPIEERKDFIQAYRKRIFGELGEEEMKKSVKVWTMYEGRIMKLEPSPISEDSKKYDIDENTIAIARLENHFFIHNAFFPRDKYLLEEKQLQKIRHIPTIIVQGRYDIVCPPKAAFLLKKGLPNAEIHYTIAGHSSSDVENVKKLVYATEKFKFNK